MRTPVEHAKPKYNCDRCAKEIKPEVWRMRLHNIDRNNTARDYDLCEDCVLVLKNSLNTLGRTPVL